MKFIDLESERLNLIKLGMFGLDDMHEYSTKEEVYTYLEFPPHKTKNETKLYLRKLLRRSELDNAHYWFVKLSEEDKIIGTFGVHDIDWRKKIGEVSYGISPDYSQRGFFSEALKTVLEFCFNELEFHRVCATTRFDNIGSVKGLKKLGFIEEGTLRDFYLSFDGRRYDALILAILRKNFLEQFT